MECGKQVLPCMNFVIHDSARFPLWKSHLGGKTASIKVFPSLGNMTGQKFTINPSLRALCHSSYVDFAVTAFIFMDYTCDEFGMSSLNVMFEYIFENSSMWFTF